MAYVPLSTATPVQEGIGAAGNSHKNSRDDHAHPAFTASAHSILGTGNSTVVVGIIPKLWLPATLGTADGGTLTTVGSAPNAVRTISLADAATQGIWWEFSVPWWWSSLALLVQPLWLPGSTDASAHTVRWSFMAKSTAAGSDPTAAGTTQTWTGASAARTANVLVKEAATSTAVTPSAVGDLFQINVRRLGADAADTYVGAVRLVGVIVSMQ
jgi:hypothetical protein